MKKSNEIITRTLHTSAALHVREAEDGKQSRTITGYAILFNTPSAPLWDDDEEEVREVIAPEAVTRALLDTCDIKMTMFHDRQLILARSKNGAGTLTYTVDEKGVAFSFEAPNTADGDKALELVRRGDISGCSFMFRACYWDREKVAISTETRDGKAYTVYTVREIEGIYDFTLAADPAYPDTTCEAEARELVKQLREPEQQEEPKPSEKMREQVQEMRRAASRPI